VFYACAALAVVSAIATVTRKNPVVAAVWLVATFFAVAVAYVQLEASFLAVLQVLVYAGAMMVLFVFVIMVLDVDESGAAESRRPSRVGKLGYYLGLLLSGGLVVWVLLATLSKQFITPGARLDPQSEFGSADAVGRLLFTDYLFAFEAISLLLLAAVIGAVVVARSRREREKHAAAAGMTPEHMHAAGLADFHGEHEDLVAGPYAQTDFGEPSAIGHEGGN
jgi:NADH-quinone oxidoreductase subunit J